MGEMVPSAEGAIHSWRWFGPSALKRFFWNPVTWAVGPGWCGPHRWCFGMREIGKSKGRMPR